MPSDDPWLTGNSLQDAATIEVFRLVEGESTAVPNVECLSIRQGEGPDPGTALFRYNLAYGESGSPVSIESALDPSYTGSFVIEPGDRLYVKATSPTGYWEYLFDGFVLAFDFTLDPGTEEVRFECEGVAKRLFDRPIGGAFHRFPTVPDSDVHDEHLLTDLPAHFNADGQPNCSPEDKDYYLTEGDDESLSHPVFLLFSGFPSEDKRRYWDLDGAVRYLLYTENDQEFVLNPTPDETAILSDTGPPEDPLVPIPSRAPLYVPNLPVTGKDLVSTVFDLVREYGFTMRFVIDSSSSAPQTRITFTHHQAGTIKSLDLPVRGTPFDPYSCNIGSAAIRRSLSEVANRYEVWGRAKRYEVSLILLPGFPMQTSDGSAANLKNYDRTSSTFNLTNRDAYRLWLVGEDSSARYPNGSATRISSYFGFNAIFNPESTLDSFPRRRPPIGELLTLGPDKRPLRAKLHISTNFTGGNIAWDGTGTWQEVTTQSWQLLKDRCGIYLTENNPNSWDIGPSNVSGHPYRSGKVRVVEAMSGAESTLLPFWLMLTVVVEEDSRLKGIADRQSVSPLAHTVTRQIDAGDRYQYNVIHSSSWFNSTGDNVVSRDDTEQATKEAEARREAAALGVIDGQVLIPYLTAHYQVGDRIDKINGRNLSFVTGGSPDGEDAPNYPVITGITYSLGGDQSTTLQLSDAGASRFKYQRRMIRLGADQ